MTPKMKRILRLLNGEGCDVPKGWMTCRFIGTELSPRISQEGEWARQTLHRMIEHGWVFERPGKYVAEFGITRCGEVALEAAS